MSLISNLHGADGAPAGSELQPSPIPPREDLFYRIDSTRVSFKEYLYGNPVWTIWLIAIIKGLRLPIPSSSDDPAVADLRPFEQAWQSLPEDAQTRLHPQVVELNRLKFAGNLSHLIEDSLHQTRTAMVTLMAPDALTIGRVHNRVWRVRRPPKDIVYCEYITAFADGTYLWSLSSKPDFIAPRAWRLVRKQDATAEGLWQAHQSALVDARRDGKMPVSVRSMDDARKLAERHHAELAAFHVARGVFRPLRSVDRKHVEVVRATHQAAADGRTRYPEIMAELDKLQRKQTSWQSAILILVVSALVFLGVSTTRDNSSWEVIYFLVPILLIHELGHYLAMKAFRYRNVRMFFIPLFGAAVSGEIYAAPGWKKIIVSLMGPLPGIFLGAGLGAAGYFLHHPLWIKAALLSVILNGFNLLPVLPFDGGRVMQALLFSRHYVLDVIFRILAAAALLAFSIKTGDKPLIYVGIFLLVGIPITVRTARIARALRLAGVGKDSSEAQSIPPETAEAIIDQVVAGFPKTKSNRILAQHTVQVYAALVARPPGWLATTGFGILYLTALVAAAGVAVLLTMGQGGNLMRFAQFAAMGPKLPLDVSAITQWPADDGTPFNPHNPVLVSTFTQPTDAATEFQDLKARMPAGVHLELFGESVLAVLPTPDASVRRQWAQELTAKTPTVFICGDGALVGMRMNCVAPDDAVAADIQSECTDYLQLPWRFRLIPPWMPNDQRSPAERAANRLARQTYVKLTTAGSNVYESPEFSKYAKDIGRAMQMGDKEETDRLEAAQKHFIERFKQQELDDLRNGARGPVDPVVVEKYLQVNKEANADEIPASQATAASSEALYKRQAEKRRAATLRLSQEVAPRMGQLPDNQTLYSAKSGSVMREGLLVSFTFLPFENAIQGPPTLARWLVGKRCIALKYNLQLYGTFGHAIDDEADDLDPDAD